MRRFWILLGLMVMPFMAWASDNVATLWLLEKPVHLVREGRVLEVKAQETELQNGDQVETGFEGKAKIHFDNGDLVYLGPASTVKVQAEQTQRILNISLNLTGKLRALVNHRSNRSFKVRTVNAIVGVKGTDFVTEIINNQTRVGTLKGLVALQSVKTGGTVDIPAGKESAISPSGKVMPLREIAGDILSGVEIAGRQLGLDESAGEKVSP